MRTAKIGSDLRLTFFSTVISSLVAAGIFLLQKTRVAMPAAKITSSCIWVAIPVN